MDWSLESFFPAFDGTEYRKFKIDLLQAFHGLRSRIEAQDGGLDPAGFAGWQSIVSAYEDIERRLSHLSSYLECLIAADAAHEHYQREHAAAAALDAERTKLEVLLVAAIGAARADHFEAFLKRDALADAAFALRQWRERARHLMGPDEEALAAELEVDGLRAWSRLYDRVAASLEFSIVDADGRRSIVPMSRRRSLMADPDRATRAMVFEGGNTAWHSTEGVCAAALNAIAGTRHTLLHRRNYTHFLEPALFQHRFGRASLDALQEALRQNSGVAQVFLRAKAARIGLPAIAWFDLEAPTPGTTPTDGERISWETGAAYVTTALGRAYPALGAFVQHMLAQCWIDHTPRAGRRPGAFCTHSQLSGEPRIFMTFDGAMNDVVTLAHEAGHAWHAHLLRASRPLAQNVPMTLAESASTFAEMLLLDGLLEDPAVSNAVKLQIVDSQTRQAAAFLLDVPMRFEFERRLYEERAEGELSATRLQELMVAAQRMFFGDALAPGGEDPMFWASKLHFYISEVSFYNFPYTVGFLLSRALFARFKAEGPAFLPAYEAFLARTGSTGCEVLAREVLGADLADPAFWSGAIASVAGTGVRLEALLPPPAAI